MIASPFEALMIFCFGLAWPVSIWKSYTSRSNAGKSLRFLCVVLLGYLSGILHKVFFSYDAVIALYILNALMISVDIALYVRNASTLGRSKHDINRTLTKPSQKAC